jgi:hypothetical protein
LRFARGLAHGSSLRKRHSVGHCYGRVAAGQGCGVGPSGQLAVCFVALTKKKRDSQLFI